MFLRSNLSLVLATSLFIAACGAKKPKELDDNSALSINNSLLERRYNFVPKDSFLSSFNWTYHINAKKIRKELLRNEQMVKTFLLAHNTKQEISKTEYDKLQDSEKLAENIRLSFNKTQTIYYKKIPIKKDCWINEAK